jgi:hypothetical protein
MTSCEREGEENKLNKLETQINKLISLRNLLHNQIVTENVVNGMWLKNESK